MARNVAASALGLPIVAARVALRRGSSICFPVMFITGCAINYYDPATRTEHLWGVGHLTMKAIPPNDGLQAVVRGTESAGLSMGQLGGQRFLGVGVQRHERIDIVQSDTVICLDRPLDGGLFTVRVGSNWPNEDTSEDRIPSKQVAE